jgi:hypothetical protein
MATQIYFWEGFINWAKVYEPDSFNGATRWLVNFYPEDLDQVKESGFQGEVREDENGDSWVRLRRDTQKLMGANLIKFAPPRLTGEVEVKYTNKLTGEDVYSWSMMEDPTLELEQVGERVSIGNGTKVVARVAIYDTQRGKGHRLEGLEIKDLVIYDKDGTQESKAADMNGEATVKKASKVAKNTKKAEASEEKAPWE